MTVRDIRIFGDPILRQDAREVTAFDRHLRRLAADMLETMRAAPGVGLSAPQVGVLKRLFTWEVPVDIGEGTEGDGSAGAAGSVRDQDAQQRFVGGAVVNPVRLGHSEETQEGDEGCLSFPGLFYPLERPLRARVRFHDLRGEEHTAEVAGFTARVWLHEIDHLDGILFIDHLAAHDRQEALRRMREYRLAQGPEEDPGEQGDNLLLRNLPS